MKLFQLFALMVVFMSGATHASEISHEYSEPATQNNPLDDPRLAEVFFREMSDMIKGVKALVGEDTDPQLALRIGVCSEAAAHPDDPDKYGKGIKYSKIKADKAITACLEAYNNGGRNIGLVNASLSRAYNKAEQYEQSVKHGRQALALDYRFADVLMGIFYEYGDGVKKSPSLSFEWYKKAANKGIASAMRGTSQDYIKGNGTQKNLNQALYWAVEAIKAKDGKAFYQLGLTMEKLGQEKSDSNAYNSLAKAAYEIADENFVDADKDILRVNKALRPNNIAQAAILDRPTIKGRNINGVFIPLEESRNWYLGETTLQEGNKHYAYARTSLNNSRVTIWYEHDANTGDSGWYAEFIYGGSSVITDFYGIRVIPQGDSGANWHNLDISGPNIEERLGIYRLTARLSARDVLTLQEAGQIKFRYDNAQGKHSGYTFPLNDENTTPGASSVVAELIETAKTLSPDCCEKPNLIPFSKTYTTWLDQCEDDGFSQSLKDNQIQQDCDQIIQTAESMSDLISDQHDRSIERILRKVTELTGLSTNGTRKD